MQRILSFFAALLLILSCNFSKAQTQNPFSPDLFPVGGFAFGLDLTGMKPLNPDAQTDALAELKSLGLNINWFSGLSPSQLAFASHISGQYSSMGVSPSQG